MLCLFSFLSGAAWIAVGGSLRDTYPLANWPEMTNCLKFKELFLVEPIAMRFRPRARRPGFATRADSVTLGRFETARRRVPRVNQTTHLQIAGFAGIKDTP